MALLPHPPARREQDEALTIDERHRTVDLRRQAATQASTGRAAVGARPDRRNTWTLATGALALVLIVVSVITIADGQPLGAAGLLIGLLGVDAVLTRWRDLGELRSAGTATVGSLAQRVPVLHLGVTCADVRQRAGSLLRSEWSLVQTPKGWRAARSSAVLDAAMSLADDVPMPPIGRRVRQVDADQRVAALPRPPRVDELWLVGDGSDPRVLTHEAFIPQA